MVTIRDDTTPILLVPDNDPISALASIRCLDWLQLPDIPVTITDQVAHEATCNPHLPWARKTCVWIVRNVVAERLLDRRANRLRSCDATFAHFESLMQSGKGFRAHITTRRHSEGGASVFNLEPAHIFRDAQAGDPILEEW
jgi:hypothetical protein